MINYYRASVRQSQKEAAAKLRPISAPTLVIWGERDSYLGSDLAEPDRDDVPNLDRVERLPDASHWVHHDEAERVNQLLVTFLGDRSDLPGIAADRSPARAGLRRARRSEGAHGMAASRGHDRQVRAFRCRPGGSYRLVLTYADAVGVTRQSDCGDRRRRTRFVDLMPGVRVVQAVDFVSDDPGYAGTMTMTWEVTEVGGGTRVDIIADNVPDGIDAEDHAAGLASSLTNLARYLARS